MMSVVELLQLTTTILRLYLCSWKNTFSKPLLASSLLGVTDTNVFPDTEKDAEIKSVSEEDKTLNSLFATGYQSLFVNKSGVSLEINICA